MKGQDMSFMDVINVFLWKHSFFLSTKNCLRRGEKGEIGNIDGFIPQSICSALCKQCIQLESQAFHSD